MVQVAVVGAGISGLTVAWELMQRGVQVTCFGDQPTPGGVVRTGTEIGFRYEYGPNTVMASAAHVTGLIDRLGIKNLVRYSSPAAKDRFIFRDGYLRKLPSGPPGLLTTNALGWGGKLRILQEMRMPPAPTADPEESIASLVGRRFGAEARDYLLDPFISGIYAGDPYELEAASAFPSLPALEREHGSLIRGMVAARRAARKAGEGPRPTGLLSLEGGLGRLPQELAKQLGDRLQVHAPITGLRRTEGGWEVETARGWVECTDVVLACPAYVASELLLPTDHGLADELRQVPYAPVAVVHLGFRLGDLPAPLEGFGCLIPRNQGIPLLGAIFASSLFPDRAPAGNVLLSCFIGGRKNPRIVDQDEQTIASQVLTDLGKIFGIAKAPVWRKVSRWPRAIPQYVIGHGARKGRIREAAAVLPGLHLAGNYLEGISLDATVGEALRVAAGVESGG
ncbi:MAG TPA: protoporphyrinogen oxidase [bacterium]|nr:protoporphyrinogen oxidase [bacterium]